MYCSIFQINLLKGIIINKTLGLRLQRLVGKIYAEKQFCAESMHTYQPNFAEEKIDKFHQEVRDIRENNDYFYTCITDETPVFVDLF